MQLWKLELESALAEMTKYVQQMPDDTQLDESGLVLQCDRSVYENGKTRRLMVRVRVGPEADSLEDLTVLR